MEKITDSCEYILNFKEWSRHYAVNEWGTIIFKRQALTIIQLLQFFLIKKTCKTNKSYYKF